MDIRSTADMDIWVNKTEVNFQKLKEALAQFGAPFFSQDEFLRNEFNVWSM